MLRAAYVTRVNYSKRCGHCEQTIPLVSPPLKMGICPTCQGDLRQCHSAQLTTVEHLKASEKQEDLAFLLSPHPCDGRASQFLQLVGRQLTNLREARKLSRSDVAQAIGESISGLTNIESGDVFRSGMTFQTYVKYASILIQPYHT